MLACLFHVLKKSIVYVYLYVYIYLGCCVCIMMILHLVRNTKIDSKDNGLVLFLVSFVSVFCSFCYVRRYCEKTDINATKSERFEPGKGSLILLPGSLHTMV